MGVLWRQSENARAEAVPPPAAPRRSSSSRWVSSRSNGNPTAAVAYALASLERADSPHARRLALRALWQGPTAFILARTDASWGDHQLSFSSDGDWLAGVNDRDGIVRLWRSDGSAPRVIRDIGGRGRFAWGDFAADGRSFVVTTSDSIRTYSLPETTEIRRIAGTFRWGFVRGQSVITGAFVEPTSDGRPRRLIKSYPLSDGAPETTLGIWTSPPGEAGAFAVDPTGQWLLGIHGGSLFEVPLRELDHAQPRLVVRGGDDPVGSFILSSDGARIYAVHRSGAWRVWSRAPGSIPLRVRARSIIRRRG